MGSSFLIEMNKIYSTSPVESKTARDVKQRAPLSCLLSMNTATKGKSTTAKPETSIRWSNVRRMATKDCLTDRTIFIFVIFGQQLFGSQTLEARLACRTLLKGLKHSIGRFSYALGEVQVIIEKRGKAYNICSPHVSLGYRPPALEALIQSTDGAIEPWLISKGIDRMIVQRLT